MLEDLQCTKDDAAIEERGAVEMRNFVFVEMDKDGTRVTVLELEAGSEVAGGGEVQARAVPPLWSWLATQSGDFEQPLRSSVDGGRKLPRRKWRNRPRDAKGIAALARRNFVTISIVLLSGIITWEISVDSLRLSVNSSVVFPVYIPHAMMLCMACVWRIGVAPGNCIWRGYTWYGGGSDSRA